MVVPRTELKTTLGARDRVVLDNNGSGAFTDGCDGIGCAAAQRGKGGGLPQRKGKQGKAEQRSESREEITSEDRILGLL